MSATNQTASFLVRFTQKIYEDEGGTSNVQWRGRISHVQGGDQLSFSDFQDALSFMQDHLAELTIKNTEHKDPEEQNNLLTKSFDMWKRIALSAPKMMVDAIKDPAKQVANIQKQISNVREEVEQRIAEPISSIKEIDSWRSATKSDFKVVMDQLHKMSQQIEDLSKKVNQKDRKK